MPSDSPSTLPVLIVGGGLAGLCCARHLHAAGVPFNLFEASDRFGGRLRTDVVDGFVLDHGFQVLLTAYPEAQRVLDYQALDLQLFYPGALIRNRGRFRLLGDPIRKPLDLAATLLNPAGRIKDKWLVARLRQQLLGQTTEQCLGGDDIPTRTWLQNYGFSERMIAQFFTPFLGGVFLDPELNTSARMFRFVFRMFAAGQVAVPRTGMQAIPVQLCEDLPGDSLHLNAPVQRISPEAITLADGSEHHGAAVVVATDMDAAGGFIPRLPTREWCGTYNLYFDAPAAPVKQPVLVLNGEGTGIINTLYVASQVNPTAAPAGRSLISVSVHASPENQSEAPLEMRVQEALIDWFGEPARAWRWIKTYHVPHALPAQTPGVLDPAERAVRMADGLYVCGDHVDQASIQGAMVSGRRAAEALLADFGRLPAG